MNDYSKMQTHRNDNINITVGAKNPIKEWTVGVDVEEGARKQLFNVANMPFIFKHVAVMPDCLHIDTEALTKTGFKKITDLTEEDEVANIDVDGLVFFAKPKSFIRRSLRQGEKAIEFSIDSLHKSIVVTQNHRMPVIGQEGIAAKDTGNMLIKHWHWHGRGFAHRTNRSVTFDEVCLLLWFWGDGSIKVTHNKTDNRRIRFGFKKQRKIDRVKYLLDKCNYIYNVSVSDKQTEIYISTESSKKLLDISPEKDVCWDLLTSFSKEEAALLVDEAIYIDGDYENLKKYGGRKINSKSESFINWISALVSIYFGIANSRKRNTRGFNDRIIQMFSVSAIPGNNLKNSKAGLHNRKIINGESSYNGDVICLECDTGFFIARFDGLTFVSGNCHQGIGATIGSVIPTTKAIIPAAVGVDLGCGVGCAKTTLNIDHLPGDLRAIRLAIESMVPHGRTDNGGINDRGAWHDTPAVVNIAWMGLEPKYKKLLQKHPKIGGRTAPEKHLGTLGSGNHFLELCIDEDQNIWIMLHSGSRGIGNRIGSYFIDIAKKEAERWYFNDYLPDINLAFLPEGSEYFDDYVEAVQWAQDYALANRQLMMDAAIKALGKVKGVPKFELSGDLIDCHHNYVEKENHFGKNIWVTRKGAIRARKGDISIIPGSMGAKSFIVRGLGNKESFMSASHGAGRKMSRTEAIKTFSLTDHKEAVKGIECRIDSSILDETPGAYKSIDAVMAAQKDLVEVVHTLKQIICIKG